jgi:hypothetical protein
MLFLFKPGLKQAGHILFVLNDHQSHSRASEATSRNLIG